MSPARIDENRCHDVLPGRSFTKEENNALPVTEFTPLDAMNDHRSSSIAFSMILRQTTLLGATLERLNRLDM